MIASTIINKNGLYYISPFKLDNQLPPVMMSSSNTETHENMTPSACFDILKRADSQVAMNTTLSTRNQDNIHTMARDYVEIKLRLSNLERADNLGYIFHKSYFPVAFLFSLTFLAPLRSRVRISTTMRSSAIWCTVSPSRKSV